MKQIRIGISSIGSGVGQSVINSCNLSNLQLYTIGFGTNPLAYGLYECDEYAYTKSFYDEDYINDIINHCLEKKIDIFFPGHDDDAHIVSKNIDKFHENDIKVIVAGKDLLDLCRDKELMSNELNKISPIFVRSFDKLGFINAYKEGNIALPVISKPSDGYASKGIQIIQDEKDFAKITEGDVIQELAIPHNNDPQRKHVDSLINKKINPQVAEISIQLVADQHGDIMGKMISYNKLNNGVPIEIIPMESDLVWDEINKFLPEFKKLGLRGPFNLQGRITDNGLKLFEMNARFTGITGLRAYMGFNEVEACIKEWMGIRKKNEKLEINLNNFGIRQTADKSIPLSWNPEVDSFSKTINKNLLKVKKNLLITGATGFIGQNLISELTDKFYDDYSIWAFTRNKQKAASILDSNKIKLYDLDDFNSGVLSMGNVDILLHLGFARPHCSNSEIAESLAFTNKLFTKAIKNQVFNIINISSQSIYGQSHTPPWTEDLSPAPELPYSQAKYATELLLSSLLNFNPHLRGTSLRLAAISGGQKGAVIHDLPSKLVHQAIQGKEIQIQGGNQELEFMDIRDAIQALIQLLKSDSKQWETVYNLGIGKVNSLKDMAEKVVTQTNAILDVGTRFTILPKDINLSFGMDSSRFKNLTHWSPQYTIDDTINSLINFQKNRN